MLKLIQKKLLFLLLFCFSTASFSFDFCNVDNIDANDGEEINVAELLGNQPIKFVPFTRIEIEKMALEAASNPVGGVVMLKVIAGEVYYYDESGKLIARRVISDEVVNLNAMEKMINEYGLSLRVKSEQLDEITELWAIYQDPEILRKKVLNSLQLRVKETAYLNRCIKEITPKNCPILDINDVYKINGVKKGQKIELPDGEELSIEVIVINANQAAQVACAIGHNIYEKMSFYDGKISDPTTNQVKVKIAKNPNNLNSFFKELSVNVRAYAADVEKGLLSALNFADRKEAKEKFEEIKKTFNIYKEAIENPTTESLNNLLAENDVPENIRFPNYPTIKALEEPVPPPLELKKRKDWVGLDVGNKKIIKTYAFAWYELRGSETAQSAQAYGAVGGFIFSNDYNIVSARADFYAGTDRVHGELAGQYLGDTWDWEENVDDAITYQHTWDYTFETGYKQYFMVGPIPIRIELGVYAAVGTTVEAGLMPLKLFGRVSPFAKAGAYAEGCITVAVASAGVNANLTVINITTPLSGEAMIKFSPKGEPYISLDIYAKAAYELMSGNVSAFVSYYVPRFGLPPWKKKTSSKTLFNWSGASGNRRIFDWGMDYGYHGLTMRGDLITQEDQIHSQKMDAVIKLSERRVAMTEYYNDTNTRLVSTFNAIVDDLNGSSDLTLPSSSIEQNGQRFSNDLDQSLAKILTLANPGQNDLNRVYFTSANDTALTSADDNGSHDKLQFINVKNQRGETTSAALSPSEKEKKIGWLIPLI